VKSWLIAGAAGALLVAAEATAATIVSRLFVSGGLEAPSLNGEGDFHTGTQFHAGIEIAHMSGLELGAFFKGLRLPSSKYAVLNRELVCVRTQYWFPIRFGEFQPAAYSWIGWGDQSFTLSASARHVADLSVHLPDDEKIQVLGYGLMLGPEHTSLFHLTLTAGGTIRIDGGPAEHTLEIGLRLGFDLWKSQ